MSEERYVADLDALRESVVHLQAVYDATRARLEQERGLNENVGLYAPEPEAALNPDGTPVLAPMLTALVHGRIALLAAS